MLAAWPERRISISTKVPTAIIMNAAKAEQEGAVDGEDRGCKHHQEGEDRKRDVIAFTAQREHAYDYAEQCQMNRCGQETAGKKKIVGCEEDEIERWRAEWSSCRK